MDQVMTITDMERTFVDEWVLVVDPVTDASLEVQGGSVMWHGGDRDEVYRKAIELRPARFAVVYTGEMPDDTAIVL